MSSDVVSLFSSGLMLQIFRCRSLCTTLRAAEKFEKEHLLKPEISALVEGAKYFYVEGYFLTHGTESVLHLARKASESGKVC